VTNAILTAILTAIAPSSREEENPEFLVSKTPGDGDCLFYAMVDVAAEVRTPLSLHVYMYTYIIIYMYK
jgi:hypothetical protein